MRYLCKDQNSGPRESATFFLVIGHNSGTKIEQRDCAHWPDLGVDDATYCSGKPERKGSACKDQRDAGHLLQTKKSHYATGK